MTSRVSLVINGRKITNPQSYPTHIYPKWGALPLPGNPVCLEDELKDFHFYTSKSHAVKFFKVPTWMDTNQAEFGYQPKTYP